VDESIDGIAVLPSYLVCLYLPEYLRTLRIRRARRRGLSTSSSLSGRKKWFKSCRKG